MRHSGHERSKNVNKLQQNDTVNQSLSAPSKEIMKVIIEQMMLLYSFALRLFGFI